MELEIWRYNSDTDSSLGFLMYREVSFRTLCHTLEDGWRLNKEPGKTRIPAGRYRLDLRAEGPMHERYAARYGEKHRGMIWVRDVPDFEWCYFHVGNNEDDTEGCPLLGDTSDQNARTVGSSRAAYERVYPYIAHPLVMGRSVFLTIRDFDRGL